MTATGHPPRQPWLHHLVIAVHGNSTVLSGPGGDLVPDGAQGLFVDDVRVLSRFEVTVGGEPLSPVDAQVRGPRAEFLGAARALGDQGADPTVQLRRSRLLTESALVEDLTLTSSALRPVTVRLRVELGADGASIATVKAGEPGPPAVAPELVAGEVRLVTGRHRTVVSFDPPTRLGTAPDRVVAEYELLVDPGASRTVRVRATTARTAPSELDADPGSAAVSWGDARIACDDPRVGPLVSTSLTDLQHLLLRDPLSPDDVFAAAGSPWYLTLFGRDSLWAARMMLPFGTELAAGTLRALARRQGRVNAPDRAEQPGKIAHEVRRAAYTGSSPGLSLPPLYYGTVDATALWVVLLVDAWRWGLPEAQVRALLPHLHAALGWLTGAGQPDADGFLKYLDTSGAGLVNQGWKDSVDSMRRRDGSIATGPIALVEAQGYAVAALRGAAQLLEVLGEPGADAARAQATALADRLRAAFWVGGGDDTEPYLAMALDGTGAPVDGLGSNMGHLLGTGALTPQEAARVARTLVGEELLDPFGVRTLGRGNPAFNPLGYHTGSIWTHDTAVVADGLAREGHPAEATRVLRALVASGAAFADRWPELYSGLAVFGRPAPYPASCRPQAWSAASAAVLVRVALGLQADVPAGVLTVAPPVPLPFGALRVEGLRWGRERFAVSVDRDGVAHVTGVPVGVEVRHSA